MNSLVYHLKGWISELAFRITDADFSVLVTNQHGPIGQSRSQHLR